MLNKVMHTIEKYNMISSGDGIVVGLSGGPDSVTLLHVLNRLKGKYNIRLYAVHLNHMIRGEEALRDEEYAKNFAVSLGIPFYYRREEVEAYARVNRLSSEEAGRKLRYELFDEIASEVGANKIALAHNMNDQAETLIMNFMRGAGLEGMSGIKPIRENKYIRPILGCSRKEIENYCRANDLSPVIDSTNKENIYTRNRIRLKVIPYIIENFNPNIIESLYTNSELIRYENEYLEEFSEGEYKRIQSNGGIDISMFKELNIALKRRIVRHLIEDYRKSLDGIEAKHIEECIELMERGSTGKRINLPGGTICRVEYGVFKISDEEDISEFNFKIPVPGSVLIPDKDIVIYTRVFNKNFEQYCDKKFIKYFDYDKIKSELVFRNRQDGDFMYPKGMTGKKKLKDIFIDKKIPKEEREKIPVIAKDNEVLWIVGLRDSRNYKVNEDTKHVLEIKLGRGAVNE